MIVLERLEYELRWLPFSNYELSELFHRSWGQMMESISTLQILLNGRHPQQLQVTHMVDVGSRKVFEIPGYLQKRTLTHALGDYCAKENFMHEQYAVTLGLPINRVERSSVRIGNGKEIKTNGTVQTSFRFRNESSQHMLKFHILPDCVQNVILGKSFLKMTQTFSSMANFTRRVKERIIDGLPARHDFLYLGDSAPKFTGLINGSPQEALADSGANMLLMDEDYARHNNIYVVDDNEHRTRLRFADGSTADTSGIAYSVQWQFGPGDPGDQSYSLDFHILKNAPSPVILNDAFLFNNNAYSKYGQYLIDDEDDGIHKYDDDHNHEEGSNIDHSNSIHGRGAIKVGLQIALQPVIKETVIFFFVIAWLPNTRSQHPKTWTSIPNQEQIELNRRGEAADHISNLAVHERTAAQADEDAIQREFDQRIAALKAAESLPSALSVPQAPPGQNAQQVPSGATSINTATQVNSTQTVTPSQQSAPQAAGTPGRKKSRFSFLKFRSRNSVSS
ncbi:hypothetical protein B0J11DRAFT_524050 [Dendryphion nanum]|uniref:Uncharacterized protein n=1 Tax=Dendryphion nanum TaxID=256645 RepID=A0A9P9E1W8_9PLEO|nr:hypothetical protein B0J11DRAFT_524050 [Dendryphion nanum]